MVNTEEIVAIIPVREGSQRVKLKNFREFSQQKSITQIKIDQLKDSKNITKIIVSSDSEKAKKIADESQVDFKLRPESFANATTPWAEVVSHVISEIPGNPIVVWALSTAPLFERFDEAIQAYLNEKNIDSLVGVLPKKTFLLNKHGKGINFNPGVWHPYSQELEPYYEVTGSVFIARKEDMLRWSYWFGPKPYLFNLSLTESVDIDEEEDFKFAQKLFEAKV